MALGVATFVGMGLFWIWAFAIAETIDHPDEFDDPSYVATAEAVCVVHQQRIADLTNPATVRDAFERAVLLEQGTDELVSMVVELRAIGLPNDEIGVDLVPQWLDDWDLYIGDRRRYADILETGQDPPIELSSNPNGDRVTDAITTFAEVNQMPSCGPSPDV